MRPTRLSLADGETRPVEKTWPDGSYECPFCGSPGNRPGQPAGCPNPGCMVNMNAAQLAAARERHAAGDARKRHNASIARFEARQAEERHKADAALWDELAAQAAQRGACLQCLAESDWRGDRRRARFIRHRKPGYHANDTPDRTGPDTTAAGTQPGHHQALRQHPAGRGCGHAPGKLWCGFCAWVPSATDLASAVTSLAAEGRNCGRCGWRCENPQPGMYERQIVSHAQRHTEMEAMSDAELRHAYVMSGIVVNPFDNHIGYAELNRRGIGPASLRARQIGAGPATPAQPGPQPAASTPPHDDMDTCDTCDEETEDVCPWCWQCPSCCDCGERAMPPPPGDPAPAQAHSMERLRAATAAVTRLGQPATDAEFLDCCAQLAGLLRDLAGQLDGWTQGLAGLNLPQPVLSPLHTAATAITGAAGQVTQAGKAFRAAFDGARQAATRGLHITGDTS